MKIIKIYCAIGTVIGIGGVLALPLWYGYFYQPFTDKIWECNKDNPSVAFALAFSYEGNLANNAPVSIRRTVVLPGKANREIASWLKTHSYCFSAIFTQRAIFDVWLADEELTYQDNADFEEDEYALLGVAQTRVYQMHRHVPSVSPARTLESLRCALDRLEQNETIVLIAHEKHYWRAFEDLSSLDNNVNIVNPYVMGIDYPLSENVYSWAFRELYIASPIEFLQRNLTTPKCRQEIALEVVDNRNG